MELKLKPLKTSVLALCVFAAACTAQYRNHGYMPSEEDVANIIVGVDTRETVAETLGSPTAGGVLNDGGFYYVRSQFKTVGPFRPDEVSRELLAVTFTSNGTVANIERFGLEDGQVVRLSRRVTDNGLNDISFLRQLLGNLGNFDPSSILQ
ncbi:outer membrane protein assembly factor BamE [Cognatishimia activa]|uniref:SmpA / OmlA family protein n=1 Tax=Cognatishimia activa TaxID=1715691 RepID=A0A0P1IU46_9RHOB|nr:outer membrane protein assembly factor BamE [Cognatishimia activa]CUJ32811.1 SmpA / OmlA family protein [Cognatishimia activa]CUK27133.1 SmpA / OmlA family protein [Cognatishimia activa]